MSNFLENLDVVKSNVINNRKNILGQIEQLEVQIASARKTIEEMDTLAKALGFVLGNAAVLEAAEMHVEALSDEENSANQQVVNSPLTAAA